MESKNHDSANIIDHNEKIEKQAHFVDLAGMLAEATIELADNKDGSIKLIFKDESTTQKCVDNFQAILETPTLNLRSAPSEITLSNEEWSTLKAKAKTTNKIKIVDTYLIKSLRWDEFAYFDQFIPGVVGNENVPINRQALRTPGTKGFYSVSGSGIQIASKKTSKFKKEEKQLYSKAQSTSMGTNTFFPKVFGFNKRDKLIGVFFDAKDALLTDRLYIYDGGTRGRPYYFEDKKKAKEYFDEKKKKVLFSSEETKDFLSAAEKKVAQGPSNYAQYNEVLARIRWNMDGGSKVFIYSDTLESRLIAQDFAKRLHKRLEEAYPDQIIGEIPIIFYNPESTRHLESYHPLEQQCDRLEAQAIFKDAKKCQAAFKNGDYECLLTLSPQALLNFLQNPGTKPHPLIYLLENKMFHLFNRLFELAGGYDDPKVISLLQTLKSSLYEGVVINQAVLNASFWHACRLGNLHLVEFFSRADIGALYSDKSPHEIAIENNHPEVLKWLLEKDPNFNMTPLYTAENALCMAVNCGHVEMVKQLLEIKKINIYHPDKIKQWTPLFIACKQGVTEIVDELLKNMRKESNTDINTDYWDLLVSCKYGHAGVVKLLLQSKTIGIPSSTNPPLVGLDKWSPLTVSARYGYPEVLETLLTKKKFREDINKGNHKERTPLFLAAKYGNLDVVTLLLKQELIDINKKDSAGFSPLFVAIKYGHIEIVKALLARKEIDLNANKHGTTMLQLAAQFGQVEIVKLLSTREDVIRSLLNSMQPLDIAIKNKNHEVVYYLIERLLDTKNYDMKKFKEILGYSEKIWAQLPPEKQKEIRSKLFDRYESIRSSNPNEQQHYLSGLFGGHAKTEKMNALQEIKANTSQDKLSSAAKEGTLGRIVNLSLKK